MIVSRREWRQLAWRNGRGTSAEILVRAGFVLNRTPLVADAPFSSYPGFDRLLVVIAGRLTLGVAGEARTLAVGDLVTFAGEADVSVHLDAGRKAEVLNLITERGIWRATGEVHEADAEHRQVAGPAIVHACGEVRLEGGGTLDEGDTLDSETEVGFRVVNGRAIVLTLRRP